MYRLFTTTVRQYATVASLALLRQRPELFNGMYTDFGWVLVPKTHVARGWTQPKINEVLHTTFPNKDGLKFEQVQAAVDAWAQEVSLKDKPVAKKKNAAQVKEEEDLRLYFQQLREEDSTKHAPLAMRALRVKRAAPTGNVTLINAWNFFMAKTYPQFKHLPPKEARRQVGMIWRTMSVDEKDVYRGEYLQLLELGKDILHGEIVDREVKIVALERQRIAKEKSKQKKKKLLDELTNWKEDA